MSGRSIGAIFAGFVTVVVLSMGTDMVMHATGVSPPRGQAMGDMRLLLALASGVVGLIVSIVGAVVTWNAGPAYGPHWYPLALIATTMPCAWVGGRLHEARVRN